MVSTCALARRRLRVLLSDEQDLCWGKTCAEHIDDDQYLSEKVANALLICPCDACTAGRKSLATEGVKVPTEKINKTKRLLATCIIAERPWLIYAFLRPDVDIDDEKFDNWISKTELAKKTGLSQEDARLLMHYKECFFDGGRKSLYTYVRSIKELTDRPESSNRGFEDRPDLKEREWLILEFLALMAKLPLDKDACARKLPSESAMAKIKNITIRDSSKRPRERNLEVKQEGKGKAEEITALGDNQGENNIINQQTDAASQNLGNQKISMQTLGYLILDFIWFLAGGGRYVQDLDRIRTDGVEWVKATKWELLMQDLDLREAFHIVWIMICPNPDFGFSKNDRGGDNFAHVSKQFRVIWRSLDPDRERNPELTSLLSQELRVLGTNNRDYEEIQPALFRWMLVRYGTDKETLLRCRLAIWKSKEKHNPSVRLDLYCIDKNPFVPWSHYADTKDLRFIPLYAYGDHNDLSAKFQLRSRPATTLTFPNLFTFQNIEDVKLFQAYITGKHIEMDIVVDHISLRIRNGYIPGFRNKETLNFTLGRLQLWQVCDDRELKRIHLASEKAKKGYRDYPVRVEIALFCKDENNHPQLIVIDVKSCLSFVNIPAPGNISSFGLVITPSETIRAQAMEGKRSSIEDESPAYPGMRLFQEDPNQEGEKVICDSIDLRFSTQAARDNLRRYIENRYNNPKNGRVR